MISHKCIINLSLKIYYMKESYFEKIITARYWTEKMIQIYGPEKEIYVSFDNANHLMTYSLDDNVFKYLDSMRIKKTKTLLKHLYHLLFKLELENVDDIVIFLLANKNILGIDNEELSKKLNMKKKKLETILNGSFILNRQQKNKIYQCFGIMYYDAATYFNVVFVKVEG